MVEMQQVGWPMTKIGEKRTLYRYNSKELEELQQGVQQVMAST